MHNTLIQDFAYILLAGGLFGWLFKRLFNLPLILGYIFGGFCLNLLAMSLDVQLMSTSVYALAELGVLLLIFGMGLHFSLPKLQSLGIRPILVSVTQAMLMWFTGAKIGEWIPLN
jgi:CPA2 family monovalent cation:H+ antiporter-2